MKYDIGEDPSNKPTGAQKATVGAAIILFRMWVAAMSHPPSSLDELEKASVSHQVAIRVITGFVIAAMCIPVTVCLDRMFMAAQRVRNRKPPSEGVESETAKLAKTGMLMVLNSVDTRSAISIWALAVESLKVVSIKAQLDASRAARMQAHREKMATQRAEELVGEISKDKAPASRLHEFPQLAAKLGA
eukprot:6051155-Prymnesium_polylepis.2